MPIRRNTIKKQIKRQRRGRTYRQSGGQQPGSVYIFYHIYCNKNTEPIVKDQAFRIIFSGLYKKVNEIKCFLTGEVDYIKNIRELLGNIGSKFKIAAEGPDDKTYERFTLLKIKSLIRPEDKFLYIHSKGVSEQQYVKENEGKPANATTTIPMKYENIYWWRTMMEYYLFGKYEECLKALDTYDVVGIVYTTTIIGPHFSGNFWWSTGSYFMTLPDTIGPEYQDPEKFLFSTTRATPTKYLDIHTNDPNADYSIPFYSETYYSNKYVDK